LDRQARIIVPPEEVAQGLIKRRRTYAGQTSLEKIS